MILRWLNMHYLLLGLIRYLYLDTKIIGHKLSSMLSIQNELTFQKEWQNDVHHKQCVLDKKVKTQQQQQNKKANIKTHSRKSNPGPLAPQSDV